MKYRRFLFGIFFCIGGLIIQILNEDNRQKLIAKSKSSEKGRERFNKRNKSKVANTVKSFNQINMDKLFKQDILSINIPVHGETDDYTVNITFGGFLEILRDQVKRTDNLTYREISRAAIIGFNRDDVFISCTCLHPETKIKLLDGTSPTIEELCSRYDAGESLYVYSVDKQGDFHPGIVERVWKTDVRTDFVKVTLDNGESIMTTPEHLFMLRDGTYQQANELKVGQSLMPLYFREANGYETVKYNSNGRYHSVYKVVASDLKQAEIEQCAKRALVDGSVDKMKYDVAIHHIDFNKSNNVPSNLQPMTSYEHWLYHANLCGKNKPVTDKMRQVSRENAIKRNANPTQAMIDSRKLWQEKGRLRNYDEDRRAQQREIGKQVLTEFHKNCTPEYYKEKSEKARQNGAYMKLSASQKENWSSNEERRRLASERVLGDKNPAKREDVREKMSIAAKNRPSTVQGRRMMYKEGTYRYIRKEEQQTFLSAGWIYKGVEKSTETRKKQSIAAKNRNFSEQEKKAISKKLSESLKLNYSKGRITRWKHNIDSLLSKGIELTYENFILNRKSGEPDPLKYYNSFEELLLDLGIDDSYNHKITSIEFVVLDSTPVYDIKVKDYHNFLLNSGVIVHNCPDQVYRFQYWSTRNKTNSGAPETRPSDITNPDDKLGSSCKHILLVLNNTSWVLRVARVISNYIDYMKKHYQKMYADIIYPAIYGKEYEEPVQLPIDDEIEDNVIDKANIEKQKSTQFQKGNKQGVRFAKEPEDDLQQEIDVENPDDEI